MRDEPEASEPEEATRVDGSTPGSKPRQGAFDDWLKDQVSALVGPRLGRYTLLRLLGEGGMGVVFAAYDEELDRKVAIKLLRTPSDGHRLDRSVLLREARAMARLNHPNIVQVYDVAEIEDQLFVAMEFVAGVSLRAWRRGWREVVAVLLQAGRGLQAAHEAGLVHCDFKPANVLVGKDGRARVLDFGLAQLQGRVSQSSARDGSHGSSLTGGTPAYMAPEVYLTGTYDARSDLFAFSVALYEGLYGRRPFAGDSAEELRHSICVGAIAAPPAGAGVPAHLRDAVLRGLASDPSRRWPSVQALLAELERDPTRVRRRRWIAGGLVAALTAGSLAAWQSSTSARAEALAACRAPEAEAARLLAPDRRATIRRAMMETGLPYAARGADAVEAALDAFVRDFTAIHAAACDDAVIHGTITPDMMSLRERCSARQLAEVSAAIDVLASADAAVVDNVGNLAADLPDPARCRDLRVLAALADDGAEAELAPRREAMRAGLARVNVEIAAGHFQRAHELVEPLLDEAERLRDRALRAEILESATACADALGDPERAEELELRGFADALAADHVRYAALLAVSRTYRETVHLGRLEEARRWSEIAEGLIDRAADDDLRFLHLIHLGGIATARGDHAASLAIYDRALDLSARIRVAVSNLWALHNNRGITLNYLGRHAEAIAAYERALALVRETYGDDHPDIARPRPPRPGEGARGPS